MAKVMKLAAVLSFILTAVFTGLYLLSFVWAFSFAITAGTIFYHFAMRLLVGHVLDRIMQNKADVTKPWYQLKAFEKPLYKALGVKKWKSNMPTYDPSCFDPKLHSWDEIAQAMCQAEIVHEVIVVLSFLPLLAAIPFGSFGVFLITSLLAALYDLSFVIMQRFNRPRVLRCIQLSQAKTTTRRKTNDQA